MGFSEKEAFSVKGVLEDSVKESGQKEYLIPVVNGKVHVSLENFEHTFLASPEDVVVYVNDAIEKDGELYYGFGGQTWDYLICSIPQSVRGFWETRRNVHLQYLLELEEAVLKEEDRVKTLFGWKKLEYRRKKGAKAHPRIGGFKKLF